MEQSTIDLHLSLEGTKFPGTEIFVKKIVVESNTFLISLSTPVLHIDENIFTEFFQSYVDTVLHRVKDKDYEIRIHNFYVTGGIETEHFGVNILSSSLNLIPSYCRHGIVLPNKVNDLQVHIQAGSFKLPEESADQINEMLDQLKAQRNVPNTVNHLFSRLKKGVLKVPMGHRSPHTVDIEYVLPEESVIRIIPVPSKGYRLMGKIDLNGGLVEYHVVDPIDFEERQAQMDDPENMVHLITSELRHHFFRYKIDLGEFPRSGYYKFTGI